MQMSERLRALERRQLRIDALRERLARLRELAALAPSRYGCIGGGHGTRRQSGQEQFIDKIDEARRELEAQVTAYIDETRRMEELIQTLPPEQKDIVTWRFLNGWSVVKVAQRAYMCERSVIRQTINAIAALERAAQETTPKAQD